MKPQNFRVRKDHREHLIQFEQRKVFECHQTFLSSDPASLLLAVHSLYRFPSFFEIYLINNVM